VATSQQQKHQAIYEQFLQHIGTYVPRSCALNLSELGWQPKDLRYLETPFSEQEIRTTIFDSPKEKALGPDGYISLFSLVAGISLSMTFLMQSISSTL
jgi:hypothetical protein